MAKKGRHDPKAELAKLNDTSAARDNAMATARRQVGTLTKVAIGAAVVSWVLALGFWSGLDTTIPLFVAAGVTVALIVGAWFVRRNLGRSEELGALLGDPDLDDEERDRRIEKLSARVDKGEHAAILAKAQLLMHSEPRKALEALEAANLAKGQKVVINQIRGMRMMLHLGFGEVKAARAIAEDIDLDKTPDLATRGNLAGLIAETWARSGNPIEAAELLDQYDPSDKSLKDVKVQLFKARAFVSAHRNETQRMKRSLKDMEEISPQLLASFVSGKRIHPLLAKEARKRLERSGAVPKPRIQMARR